MHETDPAAALPDLPCYLNGQFGPLREAKVSVMDRGFIFGDGVYEVVPVYAGQPLAIGHHLARLGRNLAALRISNPMSEAGWRELVTKLIAGWADWAGVAAESTDQLVYLQVTRGVALRDHVMQPGLVPTVFAMSNRMNPPGAKARAEGVACVTAEDFRWHKGHIKSVSLLGAVFARQISADAGAVETIMFRDGVLTEASSSNVWVVQGNTVLGAPRDELVLEGIRYSLIEDLCRHAGLGFELRRITREEVFGADELLLSSATKEVLPVTRLDGQPIGSGSPGPVYAKLHARYQALKTHPQEAHA